MFSQGDQHGRKENGGKHREYPAEDDSDVGEGDCNGDDDTGDEASTEEFEWCVVDLDGVL